MYEHLPYVISQLNFDDDTPFKIQTTSKGCKRLTNNLMYLLSGLNYPSTRLNVCDTEYQITNHQVGTEVTKQIDWLLGYHITTSSLLFVVRSSKRLILDYMNGLLFPLIQDKYSNVYSIIAYLRPQFSRPTSHSLHVKCCSLLLIALILSFLCARPLALNNFSCA